MHRRLWRALALAFLLGIGAWLIYLGQNGWVVNHILPAQYLGYFLVAFWFAGLCGFNIWQGGPLDPRNDAQSG